MTSLSPARRECSSRVDLESATINEHHPRSVADHDVYESTRLADTRHRFFPGVFDTARSVSNDTRSSPRRLLGRSRTLLSSTWRDVLHRLGIPRCYYRAIGGASDPLSEESAAATRVYFASARGRNKATSTSYVSFLVSSRGQDRPRRSYRRM